MPAKGTNPSLEIVETVSPVTRATARFSSFWVIRFLLLLLEGQKKATAPDIRAAVQRNTTAPVPGREIVRFVDSNSAAWRRQPLRVSSGRPSCKTGDCQ